MIVNNLPNRLFDISETHGKTIKDSMFYGTKFIQVFNDRTFIVFTYSGAYYEVEGVEVCDKNIASYLDGASLENFFEYDKDLLQFLKKNEIIDF